ncbi:hypothetical protein DM01DRAFT_1332780 [Hesseltinella vesiculosa]|uniref:Uncharacterized protein n=1 Tax=Hesseltinella vesiculosa TaxID=101127 RepID=A0A1X2GT51_9FUNG|nr:hypothetical protein DM01DRAFT_1332780 [Hesseltinella vesiculosa]
MSMKEHSNSIMRVFDHDGHDDYDLSNQTHAHFSPNPPVHLPPPSIHDVCRKKGPILPSLLLTHPSYLLAWQLLGSFQPHPPT